jgi:hypothetical protein
MEEERTTLVSMPILRPPKPLTAATATVALAFALPDEEGQGTEEGKRDSCIVIARIYRIASLS